MDSNQIRQLWTSFFAEREHRAVPSSSLIPPPDERTILLTTAGMVQMKPYFMGLAEAPARRMTSIQKCFRVSDIEEVGDSSHCTFFEMLGNFSVGDYFKAEVIPWAWELITTPVPDGLGLDKERIWATVYQDDDEAFGLWRSVGIPEERIVRYDESENYWFMVKGGAGPCGPNTEIYYDFGNKHGCGEPGCSPPTHDCGRFLEIWNLVFMALYQEEDGKTRRPLPMQNVDTGGGLERWAVVHMYQDGVDWQGKPKRWDTPPSIFDTDLFRAIITRIEALTNLQYDSALGEQRRAMRVVAEHARAAAFLIADGVMPANDGRGYVLRRLIRRASYFFETLGGPPLSEVALRVMNWMSSTYPELPELASQVIKVIDNEQSNFRRTLNWGRNFLTSQDGGAPHLQRIVQQNLRDAPANRATWAVRSIPLEQLLGSSLLEYTPGSQRFSDDLKRELLSEHYRILGGDEWWKASDQALARASETPLTVTGRVAFTLYDSYGFPLELTREISSEQGFHTTDDLDEEFEALMQEQRARSRAAAQFDGGGERLEAYAELALPRSEFLGYETTRATGKVLAILADGAPVQDVTASTEGRIEVVLDRTPFYAEGGGQVGDQGELTWSHNAARPSRASGRADGGQGRFVVEDTQAVGGGGISAHIGHIESGTLRVGGAVEGHVDETRRGDTMRNHTATHILHAALRHELGTHVRQAGSLVTPDRLRFDFTHLEAMTPEQVRAVEALANRVVRDNLTVHIEHMSYEKALEEGALAFFGDKYADVVRVVGVCDVEMHDCFSHELCGGTHVHTSGEVGAIIITGETSIGAGMRRIEAVTGRAAAERIRGDEEALSRLSGRLRVSHEAVEDRVEAVLGENERLRRQVQALERRAAEEAASQARTGSADVRAIVTLEAAGTASHEGSRDAFEVEGVKCWAGQVSGATDAPYLRNFADGLKQSFQVILAGSVIDDKPTFVAMSTPDVAKKCPAGDVVRIAAQTAGGNGGGRPESAQGGGTDPSKLDAALAAGRKLIEERLSS